MENFSFRDSEIYAVADILKGEKIKGVGTMPRKRLTDISNLQQQPKPLNVQTQPNSLSAKDHIQKLLMENAALRKIVNDKNKIIELSGNELQKLKINLERVQQQNTQLAHANTQMLMELNSGKDRLKSLNHELGCKNGLIEALKFDPQAKARTGTSTCQKSEKKLQIMKCEKAAATFQAEKFDGKPCQTTKRRQSGYQLTLPSGKHDQAKEKIDTKRRRQSARFKAEDPKRNEDSFEIEDNPLPICPTNGSLCESGPTYSNSEVKDADKEVDFPATLLSGKQGQAKKKTETQRRRQSTRFKAEDSFVIEDTALPMCPSNIDSLCESGPTYSNSEVKDEGKEVDDCGSSGVQQSRRLSVGRPLRRRAAEKVQSYKEVPLNVKMRR